MSSTSNERRRQGRAVVTRIGLAVGLMASGSYASDEPNETSHMQQQLSGADATTELAQREAAVIPIAAFGAMGDLPKLEGALVAGLQSGLTISEIKEVLIQLYAYAGFPRSLNAMEMFMNVVQERKSRGLSDSLGDEPQDPALTGDALIAAGTATQTELVGRPVEGALFEFSPTMNVFLRTHLFGDIFNRENLNWQSRELATLGMLSSLTGVESQLKAHIRMAKNIGVTDGQLSQISRVLEQEVDSDAAERFRTALKQ